MHEPLSSHWCLKAQVAPHPPAQVEERLTGDIEVRGIEILPRWQRHITTVLHFPVLVVAAAARSEEKDKKDRHPGAGLAPPSRSIPVLCLHTGPAPLGRTCGHVGEGGQYSETSHPVVGVRLRTWGEHGTCQRSPREVKGAVRMGSW